VALQLMQAGFRRVSVVRGGFPALVDAGVSVGYKDVAGTAASAVE
jgi:rhodanese-related sulfurtransferase